HAHRGGGKSYGKLLYGRTAESPGGYFISGRTPFLLFAAMNIELPPDLQPSTKPRHLALHRFQWIALPLMFLVPVLALLGLFGESTGQVHDERGALALYADYPTRYRYK